MHATSHSFTDNARKELANPTLRRALGMAGTGFPARRAEAIARLPEFEALRDAGKAIKDHTIAHLDHYLALYEKNVTAAGGVVHHTPDEVDDRTAATLAIAGCTAAAALAVVNPGPGDTLLIGGAGGGVGVFTVQLARLAGARVIGTGSATSADALRALGAEPVAYGDGLADRVRALAPGGVTAAIDLYGTDTVQAARELGVPDERITTIAAQVDGITPANGANAAPGAIEEIARLVAAGQLRVPIAATFPVEQIRAAVELQAGRHVHGKVVIDL